MATAQTIVNAACRKVGIPSPDASRSSLCLENLNNMLSNWSAAGLVVPYFTTEALTLVVGQAAYTIGASGNFNTVRPLRIINAYIRDSAGTDHPVDVTMTKQQYDDISGKADDARPTRLYYDPQYGASALGYIYFDYEPEAVETLYLVSEKSLSEIAGINNNVVLPDAYKEALVYNLAIAIADDLAVVPSGSLVQKALETKNNIENLNALNRLLEPVKMDSAITWTPCMG